MGEYVGIAIGSHEFLVWKNSFGSLLTIFNPEDRHVKDCINEDGDNYKDYSYITTVERAKRCLDCLGYTYEAAKSSFEKSKQEEIEFESCLLYEKWYKEEKREWHNFTFKKWTQAVKKYALIISQEHSAKKLKQQQERKRLSISEKMVLESLLYNNNEHYFGVLYDYTELWEIFRVILDAFQPDTQVVLNYTNLYEGGWCDEFPDDNEFSVPKIIILTEGKYDAEVLLKSMDVLYPYMKKFYSFIDFSSSNIQGSASFLTHYVKAFIGAGIKNRVIALYDNDAAGCLEKELLKGIKLPPNFKIITLPAIEIGKNYPTIGPTTDECVDINGRACSIELFLGRDILTENENLIPVM